MNDGNGMGQVIKIDEAPIRDHHTIRIGAITASTSQQSSGFGPPSDFPAEINAALFSYLPRSGGNLLRAETSSSVRSLVRTARPSRSTAARKTFHIRRSSIFGAEKGPLPKEWPRQVWEETPHNGGLWDQAAA